MTTISVKKFIEALHLAILNANDQITEKNLTLLDHYFEEREVEFVDPTGERISRKTRIPKTLLLNYPENIFKDQENQAPTLAEMNPIEVPLIALIPLEICSIQKATFSLDFNLEVQKEELLLDLGKSCAISFKKKPPKSKGRLKITLRPHPPTQGFKHLSETYENYIRRQVH
ncbi:DUF2589 domain-containing protein [Myroides sp. DF42-4-2]|uniref:DUF2589 domain-containing protein n=1 Tax=Myroides sp. DF42-4-2 TaxID=2746726 RepID=UPI002574BC59|nr:DUF2589 domain-containing protein [Myroides sp. DF42-4-2]MDM1407410.1 DUF2589 domain-containing protein [Myroides sp. DF42-4-2]